MRRQEWLFLAKVMFPMAMTDTDWSVAIVTRWSGPRLWLWTSNYLPLSCSALVNGMVMGYRTSQLFDCVGALKLPTNPSISSIFTAFINLTNFYICNFEVHVLPSSESEASETAGVEEGSLMLGVATPRFFPRIGKRTQKKKVQNDKYRTITRVTVEYKCRLRVAPLICCFRFRPF